MIAAEKMLRATQLLAIVLGALSILVGTIYLGPSNLVRRPLAPGQETLVVIVEAALPVWPFLFGAAGVYLLTAALRQRRVMWAHGAVIGAWSFYGFCLISAPLRSIPPSPILAGVIAMGIVAVNIAALRLWAALGVR